MPMDAIQRDELLNKLKRLIEQNIPANAVELGQSIMVSRRTVFRLMNHLKIREQKNIRFSRLRGGYYFAEEEEEE
jgi:hypothetical protein